jgi:hypothetical protein
MNYREGLALPMKIPETKPGGKYPRRPIDSTEDRDAWTDFMSAEEN